MAPEQLKAAHDVDHRADIYSLGVVFYEMLTGQLPIGQFEPPSKKVRVDVRLDEVVLKSLAQEPERRYQRASDIKTDVEAVSSSGERIARASVGVPAAGRFSWAQFCLEFVFLAGIMLMIAFAVHQTAEMNALLVLVMPWAIAAACVSFSEQDVTTLGKSVHAHQSAAVANLVLTFLGSLGLIAYGIVLEGAEAAIAGTMASGAGFAVGAWIGASLRRQSETDAAVKQTTSTE